jgi:HK97 gp10 family phage protein
LAPVDTGFLRNSITSNGEGLLTYSVKVGAEYGIHVEYGTWKMSAQPYLRPAVTFAKDLFEKGIMNVLRRRK